jgi:C-terminal processing protease CtpA/Prc
MKTINITVPPGKLGIHLDDNKSEVSNTIVSSISSRSPLFGRVFEGDYITAINGVDVHEMDTSGKQEAALWQKL